MTGFWTGFRAVYQRELRQDAGNPLAYVFIASFVSASVLLAFQVGGLFEAGRAEMCGLFSFAVSRLFAVTGAARQVCCSP